MIDIRSVYQKPLLPVVEEKFKKIDARMKLRLEQRNGLATKIKNMLVAPRPEYLATATERHAIDKVATIEEFIALHPEEVSDELILRVKRLRGVLLWSVHSEYDQRLTDAYNHLTSLDEIIKQLKIRHRSFIRTRQAATQSYEGYSIPIRQLRTRLFAAQRKLKGVMAKQGRLLETMAISELDSRRKRLEEYQIKARFALAESYDRAMKAEIDDEIKQQHLIQEALQQKNDKKMQSKQPATQDSESANEKTTEQKNEVQQEHQKKSSAEDEAAIKQLSISDKSLSQ